jgi:outer membrane protein assembly factor BamB
LYIYDQGVLSAFQLVSGEAKWRLPSVGIAGIFFDDEGMIYVNSTTATGDSIKYSKQIDVTDSVRSVILKVDPKDGKTLWTESPGGAIKYFSGKYIYTFDSHMQDASTTMSSEEGDNIYVVRNQPSFMRLRRISPKNGQVMWEHYQDRAPLDIHFDKNIIYAVFRKEVQVLTYMSF